MMFKKSIIFIILTCCLFMFVGCGKETGDDKTKVDPTIPVSISIKVKVAKVQINNEIKLNYTISPATAQGDKIRVELDKPELATYAIEGTNCVKLTAGENPGNVKVSIITSNDIKATKTIKIQVDAVESYPDLNGYTIKLGQSEPTLGDFDIKLTQDTQDKYGYYTGADKDFKAQAWEEVEENYNCTLQVIAYPSDAPWGPSRWQYILTQAQNEAAEYDFMIVPDGNIPGFVAGNALLDLTDWYAKYGCNIMTDMTITSGSYKQRLYSFNDQELNIYCCLGYNVNLLKQLQDFDDTIENPAQMYLDGNWTFESFKEYCIKVQNAMNTLFGEDESYYCLSGYGSYYWKGMVNAAGIKVLDTTQLKVNISGNVETAAANILKEIYAAGAMDTSFQVDEAVATWNAGHALINTGDYWFYNSPLRWSKTLWGSEDETRYGYVPYPTTSECEHPFVGMTTEACIVMAAGRDWAYRGFGEECTAENIYRAYVDYFTSARKYYVNSDEYDKVGALTTAAQSRFGDEESIKAYLQVIMGSQQEDGSYVGGIDEYGFFDPFIENSNPVVGNYGGSGTFAGSINDYIKGTLGSQWIDAVGTYQTTIEKSLVDCYG